MLRLRLMDRFKYYLERQLAKGALYQLLVVWMLVFVISVIGGLLVVFVREPGQTLSDAVWWAFLRLSDPGYLGDDEGAWRRFISTILTVLGYVLFMGTLVAIMTQWLFRKMRGLEQGLTPVALQHHTVILGWGSRTLPIVADLLSKRTGQRDKIAILADDITLGPTEQLYGYPELYRQRRKVVLRSGSMLNPEHLHRVAAGNARVVIIPSRSDSASLLSADAEVIKTLLSLNVQHQGSTPPAVIAELQSADKIPLARHSYRGRLQLLASDIAVARLMTQSMLHPGLAEAFNNILVDPQGSQFFLTPATQWYGKTWDEVYSNYEAAIPCGIVRYEGSSWKPFLNPDPDFRIVREDKLVLLAKQHQDIVILPRQAPELPALQDDVLLPRPVQGLNRRMLILGWNSRVPTFIQQLASFTECTFELTLVSTSGTQERITMVGETPVACKYLQLDYTVQVNMQSLKPGQFDTVILFGSDRFQSGEEADARSIMANQLLDYLLQGVKRRPQVLLELTDPNNSVFVANSRRTSTSEVVQTSSMISHVLAQLALYPQLRSVYDELLAARGNEISLQKIPASWYGSRSFRQLQIAARKQKTILLGIKQSSEPLRLNLSPDEKVACDEQLKLIVLAANPNKRFLRCNYSTEKLQSTFLTNNNV